MSQDWKDPNRPLFSTTDDEDEELKRAERESPGRDAQGVPPAGDAIPMGAPASPVTGSPEPGKEKESGADEPTDPRGY